MSEIVDLAHQVTDISAYSSLQLPGVAEPIPYGQRKIMLLLVAPETGVSQNAVLASVHVGNCDRTAGMIDRKAKINIMIV